MSLLTSATARDRRRGVAAMAVGGVVMVVALTLAPATWAAARIRHPHQQSAATCPTNAECVTMPDDAGEIVATPATGLAPVQAVYLTFSGFAPGADVTLWYCEDVVPITTASPSCNLNLSPLLLGAAVPENLKMYPSGGSELSFPVAEASPSNPFTGTGIPGTTGGVTTFACDSDDPCAIDVIEPSLDGGSNVPTAANTAVIPVQFEPPGGCPSSNLVLTESEFGIEQLLPMVDNLNCAANSAVAFNTALDGVSAVQSLASEEVEIAFTDDPDAPDQQALLSKGHYAVIPVALSANVVGFSALTSQGTDQYPQSSYELNAPEVAGLLTGSYPFPLDLYADDFNCPPKGNHSGWCTDSSVCRSNVCAGMAENNVSPGFTSPAVYGAYVRSDPSGTTYQLFNWLCAAPNPPLVIDGVSLKPPENANQVLLSGISLGGGGNLSQCPAGTETFPPLPNFIGAPFGEDAQPAAQVKALYGYALPPGGGPKASAGFVSMNWAEANLFGLDVAALQNGAGDFVLPNAASLDAAVADAATATDGSLVFNYTSTNPAAYPMPDVIYAVVSADPVPAEQASAEQQLLKSILELTGGSETSDLPPGFVPLPTSLYNQAETEVTNDIVAQPPPPSVTQPTGQQGNSPAPSNPPTSSKPKPEPEPEPEPAPLGPTAAPVTAAAALQQALAPASAVSVAVIPVPGASPPSPVGSKPQPAPPPPLGPLPKSILVEDSADRLLLPTMLVGGALIMLWGLLLLSSRTRRALVAAGHFTSAQVRRLRPSKGGS